MFISLRGVEQLLFMGDCLLVAYRFKCSVVEYSDVVSVCLLSFYKKPAVGCLYFGEKILMQ